MVGLSGLDHGVVQDEAPFHDPVPQLGVVLAERLLHLAADQRLVGVVESHGASPPEPPSVGPGSRRVRVCTHGPMSPRREHGSWDRASRGLPLSSAVALIAAAAGPRDRWESVVRRRVTRAVQRTDLCASSRSCTRESEAPPTFSPRIGHCGTPRQNPGHRQSVRADELQ